MIPPLETVLHVKRYHVWSRDGTNSDFGRSPVSSPFGPSNYHPLFPSLRAQYLQEVAWYIDTRSPHIRSYSAGCRYTRVQSLNSENVYTAFHKLGTCSGQTL
jgi:hypothetical protein